MMLLREMYQSKLSKKLHVSRIKEGMCRWLPGVSSILLSCLISNSRCVLIPQMIGHTLWGSLITLFIHTPTHTHTR